MNREQFRVLYKQFLFRMVDLELLSAHGDVAKLLGQFAALLIFISVATSFPALSLADAPLPPFPALFVALSVTHFWIATTMLVVGLFAVLSWDSTFPNKRDVLVLAPLPIRARTMFLAKVAAVGSSLVLTVVALHSAAGLIWPLTIARLTHSVAAPTLTTVPSAPLTDVAALQAVMDRDIAPALKPGAGPLAPGTGGGVSIGIWMRGERRVFSYGAAKPDSLFEVGSISKTFTGLLLARMILDGRVKLDQPVRELMPADSAAKPAGPEITLLDLATHHSGLPSLPPNVRFWDRNNPVADYHAENLYQFIGKHGVAKPAKADFHYSNIGFALLGQVLADRQGVSYPQLLQREIAGPLHLRDTAVMLSPEQATRFMQGHTSNHNPVHAWDMDAFAGAGGIRSTADDILTYLVANLHPEGGDQPAFALTHRFADNAGPVNRIGLAWMYSPETKMYLHNGLTGGFSSQAFFSPSGDIAAVVLLNAADPLFSGLLAEHLRQRLTGQPATSLDYVRIPETRGFAGTLRVYASYWITMFAAGAFIFCSVLLVQGLAAQLLPRRWFLRASSYLQMGAFCLFVLVYVWQPLLATPRVLTDAQAGGLQSWSPSYWFLGFFQWLNGSPELAELAGRARLGLAVTVLGTAGVYALSYFRTLRKIVEEPDLAPSSRGWHWAPQFGTGLQTAIVQFSVRTLMRSRQHRVMMAFFLGLAFAFAIFLVKSPGPPPAPDAMDDLPIASFTAPLRQVTPALPIASILVMLLWIVGTRVVFSMPLELGANWIFRVTPTTGGVQTLAARARSLMLLSVAPVWTVSAILFLWLWPLRAAILHLALFALLGFLAATLALLGVQKLPFTCSYLPGKSYFHMIFLSALLGLVTLVKGVEYELRSFDQPLLYAGIAIVLAAATVAAQWLARRAAREAEAELQFEETPAPAIFVLGLYRDGHLPIVQSKD